MNDEIETINTNEDVPPEVIEYIMKMDDVWTKEIKEGKTISLAEMKRRFR